MLPKLKPYKTPIYLDHAATTYLDPLVEKAMRPFWQKIYGNPSGLYRQGVEAKSAVEAARKSIASILRARTEEIIFTAGGAESVNLAILGSARGYFKRHKKRGHLIASAIEHASVLHSLKALREEGWKISLIGPDTRGFVQPNEVIKALRPDTVLVSVIFANNEVGSIQPIAQIGRRLKAENAKRKAQNLHPVLFHSDACQAAGALDLNAHKLGADLLSLNGGKIYGPKQTGLLFIKTGTILEPLIYGGGQERGLRSGTQNVAGIVGLAKALELISKKRVRENRRLIGLRNYFWKNLQSKLPDIILNGPKLDEKHSGKLKRLPNNLNFQIPGVEGESLVFYLDRYNIAIGTGSACDSGQSEPSGVLKALGLGSKAVKSSIRISLGKRTTLFQLNFFIEILPKLLASLK